MNTAVKFDNVSIVFGEKPHAALELMDQGQNRPEIEAATGQVLGVHNCSLEVAEGEILVLMGLSGSGKSTLLRAVNGLNPVVRGHVEVNDGAWSANVQECSSSDLRKVRRECVSMVFQQFGLLPWRTVRDNVAMALEFSDIAKSERNARAEKQLALVGLSDWADRKVGDLSGGMQQRVGLARAFVTEAPILLMDEPFSALDPLIRTRLQDELLELQRDLKRTIIFVSHDLDEAFKLGGRIAIMEGGRIVQLGTPREIFSNPASDYVADFVSNMNPLGVLTARDVMDPANGETADEVAAETPVADLIQQLTGDTEALQVMDGDAVLGVVTAQSIVARLGE